MGRALRCDAALVYPCVAADPNGPATWAVFNIIVPGIDLNANSSSGNNSGSGGSRSKSSEYEYRSRGKSRGGVIGVRAFHMSY